MLVLVELLLLLLLQGFLHASHSRGNFTDSSPQPSTSVRLCQFTPTAKKLSQVGIGMFETEKFMIFRQRCACKNGA